MTAGFVYAFFHEDSPANRDGKVRVKVGHSGRHPWGSDHELRGEKLAFGFDMFGFKRQANVFQPIAVSHPRRAETKLKAELAPYRVEVENGGRCNEAFDIPLNVFEALKKRTSI